MSLPGLPCGHYTHSRQLGTNKGSTQSLLLQRQNSPERYATTTRSYGSCFGTINFRKAVSCASPQLSTTANDGSEHEPTRIFNDGGLASGIYTRLPRELRNRIYAFCAQGSYDNEVIIRRSPRRTHPFAFFVRECNGHHSYQWVEDPMVAFLSSRELGKDGRALSSLHTATLHCLKHSSCTIRWAWVSRQRVTRVTCICRFSHSRARCWVCPRRACSRKRSVVGLSRH
jgi:hypothetical protein